MKLIKNIWLRLDLFGFGLCVAFIGLIRPKYIKTRLSMMEFKKPREI